MRAPTVSKESTPAHRWLLLGIVLIAAVFRLQNLVAIEHNVDHAYPIWQALMTLDRGAFPVTAQGTSVLFANPALTGYLFVLPVALTRSPVGAYVLVIALNTLAVWLAYRAARQLASPRAALLAAFLLAANPWVVEYSRTTWVQAFMPLFACLVFWLWVPVWLGTAQHSARRTFYAALAVTAMTQTYLLGFAILAPVGLLALVFRRRIPWRALAASGVVFVAVTALYAAGLAGQGDQTVARIEEFAGGTARLSGEALSHAVRLVTGRDYAAARGLDAPIRDSQSRQALSEVIHAALLIALVVGAVRTLTPGPSPSGRGEQNTGRGEYHTAARERDSGRGEQGTGKGDKGGSREVGVILLVWMALPVLLMSYVSRPVHPFYLLLTLPAGHILAAHGVDLLMRLLPQRAAAVALTAGGILIAAVGGLNVWRYAEETLAVPGAHGLTALPLGAGMDMADSLLSAQDSAEDAVIADIEDWILNSFAGRLFAVKRDTDTGHTTLIPEGGGRYLLFAAPGESPRPPRDPVDEVRHSFDDGSAVVRYRVDARSAEGCIGEHPAIPSDVGLSFLGYRLESRMVAGETAILCTAWRVDGLSTERFDWLYAPYVHIFDATGARVAIGDGSSTPGAAWRLGDVQLKMISVTLPGGAEDPFTLRFGLYDGVHGRGASFSLPGGAVAPDIVDEALRAAP